MFLLCNSENSFLYQAQNATNLHFLATRCIVQSLIDDDSSELSEELLKSDGVCLDEAMVRDFADVDLDAADIAETWQDWQPDPVDADPSKLVEPI